jgi:hypothetical protein
MLHHRIVARGAKILALNSSRSDQRQEAKTGIIKFDEHHPEIVGHMISFLYTGDYKILPMQSKAAIPTSQSTPSSSQTGMSATPSNSTSLKTLMSKASRDLSLELLVHTKVYLLADEKDISALKE